MKNNSLAFLHFWFITSRLEISIKFTFFYYFLSLFHIRSHQFLGILLRIVPSKTGRLLYSKPSIFIGITHIPRASRGSVVGFKSTSRLIYRTVCKCELDIHKSNLEHLHGSLLGQSFNVIELAGIEYNYFNSYKMHEWILERKNWASGLDEIHLDILNHIIIPLHTERILFTVSMGMGCGKSYLSKKYPNLFQDIDTLDKNHNIRDTLENISSKKQKTQKEIYAKVSAMHSLNIDRLFNEHGMLRKPGRILLIHETSQLRACKYPVINVVNLEATFELYWTNRTKRLEMIADKKQRQAAAKVFEFNRLTGFRKEPRIVVDITLRNMILANLINYCLRQKSIY